MDPSICPLIKRLDEHRKRAKCLADLFDDEAIAWRKELVEKCEMVIFDNQDSLNTKPREILFRKGYYDTIAVAKRFMHAQLKQTALTDLDGVNHLAEFISEGMVRLKKIIVRLQSDYNLDLRYLVDFTLFGDALPVVDPGDIPINKKITSLEIINFALESIHALIVSLGDLHRYYWDFGLNAVFDPAITKQLASLYYEEAFKLNPQNGMPKNQLGTLWINRNFGLDSVYYYLYSLVCPKPFELSEDNVIKLLHQNSAYLETINMDEDYQVNLKDFIARFLLIVDIFFFDKNVPTFNDLCGFLLCDLNAMLRRKKEGTGLDQDVLFKITGILFFCMRKLKKSNSAKLYHLNAFLAAICDQFVDSCSASFEEFFKMHDQENQDYQLKYIEAFQESQKGDGGGRGLAGKTLKSVGNIELSSNSATDGVSQEAYGGSSVDMKSNEKSSDSRERKAPGTTTVATKRAIKYRRRRRRSTFSSDSESDLTSNFDSDSDSPDASSEEEEDIESEDDQGEEEAKVFNTTAPNHFNNDDNDSDILIEEETVVTKNAPTNGHSLLPEIKLIGGRVANENNEIEKSFASMNFREDDTVVEKGGSGKYRKKIFHSLYDPNLVLKFSREESTMRALKVLFDWLISNKEILWECYQSNPQFVEKIMALLNVVTLNICTRKVFFHRRLLTTAGLREDIQSLFEVRSKMPIMEDLMLKHFAEFVDAQTNLDWEMPSQLNVTPAEVDLLRLFKLRNFGFFISDRRKFGYAFLNCRFEKVAVDDLRKRKNAKKAAKQGARRNEQNGRNGGKGSSSGEGRSTDRGRRNQRSRRGGNDKTTEGRRMRQHSDANGGNRPRKNQVGAMEAGDGDKAKDKGLREKEMLKKGELMKKLWLRNEVKTLESRIRGPKALELMTPYVVVDARALVDHLAIVRQLVRMEKFIVLIPSGVLADLDGMKVESDRARECIRWLDRTIYNGSSFLRTQVAKEHLLIPDYVKPRQGGRTDASRFIQIAEFCHYMTDKYKIDDGQVADVLTLLTGEDLTQKDAAECDYVGILRSISVKFETIVKFYGKMIKK